jgi:hypothetical protein
VIFVKQKIYMHMLKFEWKIPVVSRHMFVLFIKTLVIVSESSKTQRLEVSWVDINNIICAIRNNRLIL